MKKTIFTAVLTAILCLAAVPAMADDYSTNYVSMFADNITKWTTTSNAEYRFSVEDMCDGKVKARVTDELSRILAKKANPQAPVQSSYEMETYLNNIGKQVGDNGIRISYTNFKRVDPKNISVGNKVADKYIKNTQYVSCNIKVTGSVQHEAEELFYVYNSKIAKIDKYEVDNNGKVKVRFDDLTLEENGIGLSYNYAKDFPVGATLDINFAETNFMVGIDFGYNFDDDKVTSEKVEMTDLLNYKKVKTTLDPKFYLTISPQFYMKYFSVGCGFGVLYLREDKTETEAAYSATSSSSTGNISSSSTLGDPTVRFMVRPVVKGFLPLSDTCYLSANVAYNYAFGYTKKNGLSFGLGLLVELY